MTLEQFVNKIETKLTETISPGANWLEKWRESFNNTTPPGASIVLPTVGERLLIATNFDILVEEAARASSSRYVFGGIDFELRDKFRSKFIWRQKPAEREFFGVSKADWVYATLKGTTTPDITSDDPTLTKIRALSQLKSGWDSYGGVPPSSETCARAIELLSMLSQELSDVRARMTKPFVAPCSDGSIQLEWEEEGKELHLVISPPLTFPLTFMTLDKSAAGDKYIEGEFNSLAEVSEALRWLISARVRNAA